MHKYNFELVFAEYSKFGRGSTGALSVNVYSKAVLFKAFQHLLELELLTLVENHVDGLLLEYQMACMRIYPQAVIAAVESEDDEITCPTALLKWAKETGTS